jgi:hypothetical protein
LAASGGLLRSGVAEGAADGVGATATVAAGVGVDGASLGVHALVTSAAMARTEIPRWSRGDTAVLMGVRGEYAANRSNARAGAPGFLEETADTIA